MPNIARSEWCVSWRIVGWIGVAVILACLVDIVRRWPRALLLAAIALIVCVQIAVGQEREHHSNPWLLSWIPSSCCVTNDCCWQISEREVRPLPDDQWQVLSTGQIRKRTNWSPDGRFYRCACDYDAATRKWIRHQGANTLCIFVPMRNVKRPQHVH